LSRGEITGATEVTDTAELKSRVESAIERLTASAEERRQSNQSLAQVLASLESKYNARGTELAECHERIRELSESNDRLTALLERIVEIIESHANDDGDAAIRRAGDMAKDIVRSWGGNPAADAPEMPVARAPVVATPAARLAASGGPVMRFEDVSAEELAAELLAEDVEAAGAEVETADMGRLAEASADVAPAANAAAMRELVEIEEPVEVAELEEMAAPAGRKAVAAGSALETPVFDEVEVVDEAPAEDTAAEAPDADEIAFEPSAADEVEEVEIDIPPPAAEAAAPAPRAHEVGRDDIRAMLERLERAASRAQAFAEQQGKSRTPGEPPGRGKERAG
jgi:hypothetical protein